MTSPAVSIIIPCYNRERFIGEAIGSALGQGPDVEVIVVDDGSSDSSWSIISSFAGVDAIRIQNSGPGAARNAGIARARSPFVKFLDSDDRLPADAVQPILAFASGLGPKQIAFGDIATIDEQGGPISGVDYGFRSQALCTLSRTEFLGGVMTTTLPLYPAAALRSVHGFDPRIRLGEDMELSMRLAALGYEFVRFPEIVCELRQHGFDRLSRRYGVPGYRSILMAFELSYAAMLNSNAPLTQLDRRRFATHVWSMARAASRERLRAEADALFALAGEISGGDLANTPLVLKLGYQLASPYRAERWLELGKRLLRRTQPTP